MKESTKQFGLIEDGKHFEFNGEVFQKIDFDFAISEHTKKGRLFEENEIVTEITSLA